MLRAFSRLGAPASLAALLVLAAGCAGEPGEPAQPLPIEEDVYVAIMARMDLIRRRGLPTDAPEAREALADSAREALLAERGVAPGQLLRFAEIVGADPARMEAIADRIAAVADSLLRLEAAAARDAAAAVRDSAAAPDSAAGRDPAASGAADSVAVRNRVPTGGSELPANSAGDTARVAIPEVPVRSRLERPARIPSRPRAGDTTRVPPPPGAPSDST